MARLLVDKITQCLQRGIEGLSRSSWSSVYAPSQGRGIIQVLTELHISKSPSLLDRAHWRGVLQPAQSCSHAHSRSFLSQSCRNALQGENNHAPSGVGRDYYFGESVHDLRRQFTQRMWLTVVRHKRARSRTVRSNIVSGARPAPGGAIFKAIRIRRR